MRRWLSSSGKDVSEVNDGDTLRFYLFRILTTLHRSTTFHVGPYGLAYTVMGMPKVS